MGHRFVPIVLAALAATGLSGPATAQETAAPCRLCDAKDPAASDRPATPVTLSIEASLDFDKLIYAGMGDGSAEIGPDGARRVTGSITAIGARAMVGHVVIRGEPGRFVRVVLPDRIMLTGLSGGIVRLESIRSDLSAAPRIGSDGTLSFKFGGVLRMSGDIDGEFRGDVSIDVDYF